MSWLRERHILVVEDEYLIAEHLRRSLEQAGAIVVGPAPSVARALPLLDAARIDAAILDVNLGGETSFCVARALEDRAIPFLFATGYNNADVPSEWHHVPRLEKPLRIENVGRLFEAVTS